MRHGIVCSRVLIFIIGTISLPGDWCSAAGPGSDGRGALHLDVTRDTWVSQVGQEADGNNGAASRLKLKSIQEMTLLDVDTKALRGRTIRGATLHVKLAGDQPLRRVTVSSVGAEWSEGTGSSYAVQPGGATFLHRRHPDLPWSITGGDLCHVVLGNGGSMWRMADASPPDADGWQHVPIEPRVVACRVAGLGYGFLVFDDTGSEWSREGESFTFRLFPNRFVFSRDQNRSSAPYLTVEVGGEDHRPPAAPAGLRTEPQTEHLPAGEAIVSWVTPRDAGAAGTLGYTATLDDRALPRELIPLAGAPGARVEMHLHHLALGPGKTARLSVRAVDAAGNVGSPRTASVRLSDGVPARLPQPAPQTERTRKATPEKLPYVGPDNAPTYVAIIDELDKVNPASGELIPPEPEGYLAANHLWDAATRRISVQAARNEFVAFQVLLRSAVPVSVPVGRTPVELAFDGPAGKLLLAEVGRYHTILSRLGPLADPIVPVSFPLRAPAATSQSFHVEIYVPHSLPAGEYKGTLSVGSPMARGSLDVDGGAVRLPVVLQVWDFTLPDHLSFLPEMNCYGLPGNERDYYRLAHRHRTVLNRLPYSQSGQVAEGCAPRWDARRQVFDWSLWDRRFGPLLDGSAFADLPRRGVPLECFYLPLFENWPSPMEGNYNGDYWADRAFPESYRRAFVAAAREFAAHIRARRWSETLFQGFLNNKVDFKARGWSRGSSPWLLDEPASFQDFWALRYFGRAFHEGINQAWETSPAAQSARAASSSSSTAMPRLVFRADISRPQWRRDSLDGTLDYLVVSSAMRMYPQLVFERKRTFGEIVLEYGSTNPVEGSNFQPVGWCLDAWSLGADGVIPWQTVGTTDSWERVDELSLFYPGRGRAPGRTPGGSSVTAPGTAPVPSIRLKAYRRGQQDVEYLALWSSMHKQPRWAVGAQVKAALKLAGARQGTGVRAQEDAGRIDYASLRPGDLWAFRRALGADLSNARPKTVKTLVDFRTPRRDPSHLAGAYVGE